MKKPSLGRDSHDRFFNRTCAAFVVHAQEVNYPFCLCCVFDSLIADIMCESFWLFCIGIIFPLICYLGMEKEPKFVLYWLALFEFGVLELSFDLSVFLYFVGDCFFFLFPLWALLFVWLENVWNEREKYWEQLRGWVSNFWEKGDVSCKWRLWS